MSRIADLFNKQSDVCDKIKQNLKRIYKKSKVSYILNLFIFLFFFSLFLSLCFFNTSSPINGITVDPIGQLIMATVFSGVILILYKVLIALWNLRVFAKLSFGVKLMFIFMFLFSVQLLFIRYLRTWIGWDVANIVTYAVFALDGNTVDSHYLSLFPNNLLIFFIIHYVLRFTAIFGLSHMWLFLAVFNTILVDIALFASIITVRKFNSSIKTSLLLFILLSLLVGLTPWIIVPYSDTFLMPIVSLLILSCLLTAQAITTKKRIFFASVCGLLFALGWFIKPTIISVAAALVTAMIINALKKRFIINFRHTVVILLSGGLVFCLTAGVFNLFVKKQNIIGIDETIKTPASYTIATGLNYYYSHEDNRAWYGTWNYDVDRLNYGTTEEKNERFNFYIRERLREFGHLNYTAFLFNKARWLTSEGYFYWLGEGGGTADFSNPERNILSNIIYPTGKFFSYYLNAVNGLWIVVFFGLVLGMLKPCITGLGEKESDIDFYMFTRFVVFFSIFILLFTEGRSRYLISFLPVFCIISTDGFSCFGRFLKDYKTKEKLSCNHKKTG